VNLKAFLRRKFSHRFLNAYLSAPHITVGGFAHLVSLSIQIWIGNTVAQHLPRSEYASSIVFTEPSSPGKISLIVRRSACRTDSCSSCFNRLFSDAFTLVPSFPFRSDRSAARSCARNESIRFTTYPDTYVVRLNVREMTQGPGTSLCLKPQDGSSKQLH
jgi:hypothetical protein